MSAENPKTDAIISQRWKGVTRPAADPAPLDPIQEVIDNLPYLSSARAKELRPLVEQAWREIGGLLPNRLPSFPTPSSDEAFTRYLNEMGEDEFTETAAEYMSLIEDKTLGQHDIIDFSKRRAASDKK